MYEIMVIFASATTASRVKKYLSGKKYYAKVVQTPKQLSEGGCSYAVKTTSDAMQEAKDFAKRLDVKIRDIYKISGTEFVKVQGKAR